MGYISHFKIETRGESLGTQEKLEEIVSEYFNDNDDSDDGSFCPFSEECKWYDMEKDMIKFSKLYPNTVFIVERVGEDRDDYSKHVFYNGKYENSVANVIIEYPPINWKNLNIPFQISDV